MARRTSTTKSREPRVLSTAQRLARSLGPDVVQVIAPITGEKILVDRPDIAETARARQFPAPLTAMVRTIISQGTDAVTTPKNIDKYVELCYEMIVACARCDPPELIEAMDADEADHEAAVEKWQKAVDKLDAESRKLFDAKSDTKDESEKERIELEWKAVARKLTDLRNDKPKPENSRTREVLRSIDSDELKPLFVRPGDEPDEDQLILLPNGDSRSPRARDRAFKFSTGDYVSLGSQIMTFQEGGLGFFRDIA